MAQYRFRLQSILTLRERDRDKAAQSLQQAQLARQKLLDQIDELHRDIEEQNQLRGASNLGQVDVQRVLDAQRYQLTLIESIRGIQVNIGLIDQEIERRRAKLVVAEQGVKALEKLSENQRQAWNEEQATRSQSRLDEWASFQHYQRHAEP